MRLAALIVIFLVLTPIQAIDRELGKKNKDNKEKDKNEEDKKEKDKKNKDKKNKGKKNKGKKNKGKKNKGKKKNKGNKNTGVGNKGNENKDKDKQNRCDTAFFINIDGASFSSITDMGSKGEEFQDWGEFDGGEALSLTATTDSMYILVDDSLYTVELDYMYMNFSLAPLQNYTVDDMAAISAKTTGELYGITVSGEIYEIAKDNGIATYVSQADPSIDGLVDIGFAKSNRLYAIDETNVFEINLKDGTVDDLGEVGNAKEESKEGKWGDKKNKNNKDKLRRLGKKNGYKGKEVLGAMSGLITDNNNLYVVRSMERSPYALLNPKSKGNGQYRIRVEETELDYPGSGAFFCPGEDASE